MCYRENLCFYQQKNLDGFNKIVMKQENLDQEKQIR